MRNMNDFRNKTDSWNGWLSGWTLAAPSEELERETFSYLDVTLSRHPFLLECSTPGVDTLIHFKPTGRTRCLLCAQGIRIVDEHADQDLIASCLKIDSMSLAIETDRALINDFLNSDELEHHTNESFLFLGAGQYHLAVIIQHKVNPVRLSMVAGTGDREQMLSRARAHLSLEVHQTLDKLLSEVENSINDNQPKSAESINPLEYLKSRMRPATQRIPHPWLADSENEPLWNLGITYLVANGLILSQANLAIDLLRNLLEMMDTEGDLPMAGGNISHPFNGPTSHPLLARLTLQTYLTTRRWPSDADQTIDRIHLYLDQIIKSIHASDSRKYLTGEMAILIRDEVKCLSQIYQLAGRSSEDRLRKLRTEVLPVPSSQDDEIDRLDSLLLALMSTMADSPTFTDDRHQIKTITSLLSDHEQDVNPTSWLLTMTAAENLSLVNYRLYSEWITGLNTIATTRWSQISDRAKSNADILNEPGMMALAGFLIWCADRKHEAFNRTKLRQQTITSFMNRRKKWLLGSAVVLTLALGIFLISVQMRSSMPNSIFETNYGMAVQLYQTGMFDESLRIIEDMENRGATYNPTLVFQKGKIYYREQNFSAAVDCFTFCRDKVPDNPAYSYNLGLSLAQNGDRESARLIFDSIMTTFKTAHPALASRARVAYTTLNDMEKMNSAIVSP